MRFQRMSRAVAREVKQAPAASEMAVFLAVSTLNIWCAKIAFGAMLYFFMREILYLGVVKGGAGRTYYI